MNNIKSRIREIEKEYTGWSLDYWPETNKVAILKPGSAYVLLDLREQWVIVQSIRVRLDYIRDLELALSVAAAVALTLGLEVQMPHSRDI